MRQNNPKHKTELPPFILMSDENYDPFAQLAALPQKGIFILRHYGTSNRKSLVAKLITSARNQKKLLLLASTFRNDFSLAFCLRANGVHLPEWQLGATLIKRKHPNWLISAAVHSRKGLIKAESIGADFAVLAPALKSKNNRAALNPVRIASLTLSSHIAVYALGGVNPSNARRLQATGIAGWAAVSAFDKLE